MINSVKHWYPDIPMEALLIDKRDVNGRFDLRSYCQDVLNHGYKLLDKYDRIIFVDPDSIMCNLCPDLFDDYKLGCVQNNVPAGPEYGGSEGVYINAGLCVCTDKKAWKMILDEYDKRNNEKWWTLNHQNALNWAYHQLEGARLLEFPDRTYGITSLVYYQDMELKPRGDIMLTEPQYELWLPNNKKLCLAHFAGVYWKVDNEINFDFIKNKEARKLLISYTK